ncbi:MAG: peroxidase-related enzyme [Acidimicrobiales bacterium]|nr:peroxidase-related enzyme [Acidimicrobiales bacterium]MDP6650133.1 peroxidase-related enzyme [Acidimicrobiales bacterium]MDP6759511.1 peroxidase-related enzyme [Acidimicrobiales bacterium]MDP7508984.1 peroxidase-related enzyme [Acidimicrobiales bacterium]MDP7541645.1 peroxidase-related enzyme [Acidimicrobiales bacterium]
MTHHRRGLRRLLRDDDLVAAVEADWRSAPISDQRRAMLGYAIRLTTAPGEVAESDIDALRTVGFSDRDILDIAEVTAYYAYANRIADGLGITTEPWIPDKP